MAWMERSLVDQRERFIRDHRSDLYAMAELCARYGVSRKTGGIWSIHFCHVLLGRADERDYVIRP